MAISRKEQHRFNDYEKQLQKPKWTFIRFYALSWFCLVFACSLVSDYFFEKEPFILLKFLLRLLGLAIGSLLYALFIRWLMVRGYKKLLQKQPAVNESSA